MTRPTAAFVGLGFSNPIVLRMNRGLHVAEVRLLSIDEALALVTDLTGAISKACAGENPLGRGLCELEGEKDGTHAASTGDLEHPGGAG